MALRSGVAAKSFVLVVDGWRLDDLFDEFGTRK
jgi:hypothetical protein